jgi:hypothetical protein
VFSGEELRKLDTQSGSTGNYGLQDQRMAFDWVRRNIGENEGEGEGEEVEKAVQEKKLEVIYSLSL